jgi:outer membrane protein assembly factor BamA
MSSLYGFGFEVINRGGSVPSGTVTLPNLPPVGLPSNFKTSQVTFYGPRGSVQYTRNNLRGKDESLSLTAFAGRLDQRAGIYYIDPTFAGRHWKSTSSFSYERDEENPIFSSQQEIGSYQIQRFIDRAKRTSSSSNTATAKPILPASKYPCWCQPRISTSASPALEQTSPTTRAIALSMNTKACSALSRSISTQANSAAASILQNSPRKLLL